VPRIAVVIPALDEETAIGLVVGAVPPMGVDVVVVDNGSRDHTAERAAEAGARVVREPRAGYGQACLAGIAAVPDADVVAFMDGDFSDDPRQLPDVLAPLLAGEADLVIGSRVRGTMEPGAHPWHAVLGTHACVGLMNLLIGTKASDLGPFRALTRDALRTLDMQDRGFGWTVEMQIKARLHGLRVCEVPVDYRCRRGGHSKVSGSASGTVRAALKIVGTIARFALSGLPAPRPAAMTPATDPLGPRATDHPGRV
jgi:glycosyltransferase involved in cell wall biosynthesis